VPVYQLLGGKYRDEGLDQLAEDFAAVREQIGYEMPVGVDDLGPFGEGSAAATENFVVRECPSVDNPWWEDLVTGIDKPIVDDGYVTVPEKPGIGVDLNEEHGGASTFSPDWTPVRDQQKMSVRQARHVWTLSKAAPRYFTRTKQSRPL